MDNWTLSWANLRRTTGRHVLILFGMILAVGTVTAVITVVEAMNRGMSRQVTEQGYNLVLSPATSGLTFSYGGITLPEILIDTTPLTADDLNAVGELSSLPLVRAIAPRLIGHPANLGDVVTLVGTDLETEFMIKPWLLPQKGAWIDIPLDSGTAVLGHDAARLLGIGVGDAVPGREGLTVAAILRESGGAEDRWLLVNWIEAQELLGRPGEITLIDMAIDHLSGSEQAVIEMVQTRVPNARITSLRQDALRRNENIRRFRNFGLTLGTVILLGGLLLVTMTMSGAVRERSREIGVLRALGFRRNRILAIVLLEGGLLGALGGLWGYLIGWGAAVALTPVLSGSAVAAGLSGVYWVSTLAASTLLALLSTLPPALKAAHQDPVEALRFF